MSKVQNNLVPGASASVLRPGDARYPAILLSRLGSAVPATLFMEGGCDGAAETK